MKTKQLIISLVVLLTSFSLQAQPQGPPPGGKNGGKKEQIESMKVAFITKRLDLTTEEAQRFWPVYNQFSDELKKIRKDRRGAMKEGEDDIDAMNDKDVEKIVDSEIVSRQMELDVMKKYNAQFKQILPIKKVAKLYRSEEEFKRELLERIRERRQQGGGERRAPQE